MGKEGPLVVRQFRKIYKSNKNFIATSITTKMFQFEKIQTCKE